MTEAPTKRSGHLRFVVVSDTHGWKLELAGRADQLNCCDSGCGRIFLPKGDILLHCGDLLNEGVPLGRSSSFTSDGNDSSLSVDSKLVEVLQQLDALSIKRTERGLPSDVENDRDKYKWVFLVGGNHDAPLHTLAATARLAPLLGDSVILLQSPAEFDCPCPLDADLPSFVHSTAKNVCTQSNIFNGATRILADCTLCPPHLQSGDGVVLAGSGLSLANNAWSANRAFQIQRDAAEKLKSAAKQLLEASPDIVMTHGPPHGHADEKKGDVHLRNALDSSSAKVHVFGHAHSNCMGTDTQKWKLHGETFPGRSFVNASMVTSLYLPTRLPIVMDLPVYDVQGQQGAL